MQAPLSLLEQVTYHLSLYRENIDYPLAQVLERLFDECHYEDSDFLEILQWENNKLVSKSALNHLERKLERKTLPKEFIGLDLLEEFYNLKNAQNLPYEEPLVHYFKNIYERGLPIETKEYIKKCIDRLWHLNTWSQFLQESACCDLELIQHYIKKNPKDCLEWLSKMPEETALDFLKEDLSRPQAILELHHQKVIPLGQRLNEFLSEIAARHYMSNQFSFYLVNNFNLLGYCFYQALEKIADMNQVFSAPESFRYDLGKDGGNVIEKKMILNKLQFLLLNTSWNPFHQDAFKKIMESHFTLLNSPIFEQVNGIATETELVEFSFKENRNKFLKKWSLLAHRLTVRQETFFASFLIKNLLENGAEDWSEKAMHLVRPSSVELYRQAYDYIIKYSIVGANKPLVDKFILCLALAGDKQGKKKNKI